jgi:Flp pilus assembly protein TadD
MLKNTTVLGVLALSALAAGCSHDATANQPIQSTSVGSPVVTTASVKTVTEPVTPPIDVATARTAWKSGVTMFDNGDYQGASKMLKTAVAGEPKAAYRQYLLGLALWKSGDRDAAEAALVESGKLNGTSIKTFINLARVRHDRGDRAGALEAAEQALTIDSNSADALHQKGRALMELGRGDEALVALTSSHNLEPGNGYVANTLGLLLIQMGKPAEAVSPLEAAKLALPNVGYVRNNLAVAYERTGRLDEAKLEYLAAVDAGGAGGKAIRSLSRLGATDTTDSTGSPDGGGGVVTASAEDH